MNRESLLFLLLLSTAVAAGGCGLEAGYRIHVDEPHKDLAVVRVYIPDRLDAEAYRRIARKELRRVQELRRQDELPLYQVRFEFFIPDGDSGQEARVASLIWKARSPYRDESLLVEDALVLY